MTTPAPRVIVHKPEFESGAVKGARFMLCTCGTRGPDRMKFRDGVKDINEHVLAVRRGLWLPPEDEPETAA